MMEVKHNTPMEFNDLVTSSNDVNNSIGSPITETDRDQLEDDAVMDKVELLPNLKTTLVEEEADDILKTNEPITNGTIISSSVIGSTVPTLPLPSAVDLEDVDLDMTTAITPELEEELLADDETDVVDKLLAEVAPASNIAVTDDLVEDESTELEEPLEKPATNNVDSLRDPGDDLDTLLSKINDIVEDCSVPTDAQKDAGVAVEDQVVVADDKLNTTAMDTDVTMDDSVIVLEDSVCEQHIESEQHIECEEHIASEVQIESEEHIESEEQIVNEVQIESEEHIESEVKVTAAEVAKDASEVPNADTASEDIEEPSTQLELPEAEKSCKEDDVMPMEQEEVISGSDQMILDVDLDALNQEQLVKSKEPVIALEPALDVAPSPKSEEEAEKVEEEKEKQKDKIVTDDSSPLATEENKIESETVDETEENKVVLETADEKVISETVVSTELETLPIVEEAAQPDTVATSAVDEPNEKDDNITTEPTADEVTKTAEETDNALKEVETPKDTPATTKTPPPSINLDVEDSDDDIVFFCEKSKSSDDTNQQAKSMVNEIMQKEPETNTDPLLPEKPKEDDDVVLVEDDDDDDEPEVGLTAKPSEPEAEQIKIEKDNVECKAVTDETTSTNVETEVKQGVENKSVENREVDPLKELCDKLLLDDNSDNARDKFGDAEIADKQPEVEQQPQAQKSAEAEESNSNCSSSSNLLQESKAVASSEGGEEETDLGNDDDDDAADNDCETLAEVEIIETEVVDDESKECDAKGEDKDTPPAKRMRLSNANDDDEESSKMSFGKTDIEDDSMLDVELKTEVTVDAVKTDDVEIKEIKTEGEKISNKRAHDDSLLEDNVDQKKNDIKKLKTEEPQLLTDEKQSVEISGEEVEDSKSDIIEIKDTKEDEDNLTDTLTAKEDAAAEELAVVPAVKAVPSHIPVPLYPPPVFEDPAPKFSYDFLKRFKKSLDKLSKNDLEELVMQKIAEAIIHKSEFGEMRELIEKQEKTIAAHRTKITELSKQFRDLEMVHNRVLKDIETKNSQFLMPVKITRAVGLQVFIPLKKNSDPVSNAAANSVSVSTPQQTSQQSPHYRSTGNSSGPPPLASPLRQSNNIDSSSSNATSSNSSALLQRTSNSALASAGAAASINSRRGCVQKITPQRPLESGSVTSSQAAASAAPASYRVVQSHVSVSQQIPAKLLNKSASASAIAQMRNRYSGGSSSTVMQQQQQQTSRQQPSPTNNVRKVVQAPPTPAKQASTSSISQQFRRSESTPQTSISPATTTDNYMNSGHQVSTSLPSVSITPAKPKDKSVIDLTDEDDAPTSVTPTPTAIRQRLSNTPTNNSGTSASSNYLLNKVTTSHVRVSPVGATNQPKPAARQQITNLYGSKSNGTTPIPTNISTPPGTSITRIQVNTNMQRVKYGHPAPLPPTPAQNLHPAWKLPPPRPTIRISNLDNGIVISWTVEESMDRHADCVSYQIYAYQETSGPPLIDSWRHVGDVKAMLLPMAVTLTQFQEGQRYFFAVRAVDVHHRVGPFSVPKTWS